jgi:hypothetical protein
MPTPAAMTTRTMTATAMAILPIPLRELVNIHGKKNPFVFKVSRGLAL